jgi:hypothetical protein
LGLKEGAFNIGIRRGGGGRSSHMVGTLPSGVNVESGSQGTVYGGPTGAADMPLQYHLDVGEGGAPAAPTTGDSAENPTYVSEVKDSGGKQLGKDIVSGMFEILGIGDIFKDPTQFGLFKIFKGIMGLKPGEGEGGSSSDTSGDVANGILDFIPGQGGGGNIVDFATSFIPKAEGSNTATVDNSFNLTMGDTKADADAVIDQVNGTYLASQRAPLRQLPKP